MATVIYGENQCLHSVVLAYKPLVNRWFGWPL